MGKVAKSWVMRDVANHSAGKERKKTQIRFEIPLPHTNPNLCAHIRTSFCIMCLSCNFRQQNGYPMMEE